jgi:hypothetical protein
MVANLPEYLLFKGRKGILAYGPLYQGLDFVENFGVVCETIFANLVPVIARLPDKLALLRVSAIRFVTRWTKGSGIIFGIGAPVLLGNDVMHFHIYIVANATAEVGIFSNPCF